MLDPITNAPGPVVLGEVLFDCFPDGREVLGGAPFNVAWHLRGFGLSPRLVTRVGDDPRGAAVRDAMAAWGLDDRWVQTDPERATGRVEVGLRDGEPCFDIPPGQAFDRIAPPAPSPVEGAPLLYHGTLALRESGEAVLDTLRPGCEGVFLDVNLRDPWWDPDRVRALMGGADWVKLNHHELARLARDGDAAALCAVFDLRGLVVTEGARRVRWHTREGIAAEAEPPRVDDVADTVGAGDAFSAVCLVGLAAGARPAAILDDAVRFAAEICRRRGATAADPALYARPTPTLEEPR